MKHFLITLLVFISLTLGSDAIAQTESEKEAEELKVMALEALMNARPERALPRIKQVLEGTGSTRLKARALFVLSQLNSPEATEVLLNTATATNSDLQAQAIRMIGISGDQKALAGLLPLYHSGDGKLQEKVLQAFIIANEPDSVYELAVNAKTDQEFDRAVRTLGVMQAVDKLRQLKDRPVNSESLIHALAISRDHETLQELALDSSKPKQQIKAIRAMGIVGGDHVGSTLATIFKDASDNDIKEAALHGLLVANDDERVLELFKASDNAADKKRLLRILVNMNSDLVLDVIDETLEVKE